MSDRGGGIPRSLTDQLFHYMYSTAPQPSQSDAHTVPLAGNLIYFFFHKIIYISFEVCNHDTKINF